MTILHACYRCQPAGGHGETCSLLSAHTFCCCAPASLLFLLPGCLAAHVRLTGFLSGQHRWAGPADARGTDLFLNLSDEHFSRRGETLHPGSSGRDLVCATAPVTAIHRASVRSHVWLCPADLPGCGGLLPVGPETIEEWQPHGYAESGARLPRPLPRQRISTRWSAPQVSQASRFRSNDERERSAPPATRYRRA